MIQVKKGRRRCENEKIMDEEEEGEEQDDYKSKIRI